MHVGFDAKRAFENATGLGNLSRDALRVLAVHRPGHRYVAYGPHPTDRFLGPGVEARGPDTALWRLVPSAWRLAGLAAQLRRDGVELYHGLTNELPLGLERTGLRSVVTIADLIFERHPELYQPVDVRIYRWKFGSAARRADLVVAISDQTRRDLVDLYRVDPQKIRVVYPGCHPAFQEAPDPAALEEARARLALPRRYLLNVGTIERRKNVGLVVKAMAGLPEIELLVVGRQTAYAAEVLAEARGLGLGGRVRFLTGVTTADLVALNRLATAVVYPSIFEGFGIPIVEALFCGAPVVTTAGGVFPEAGGPGSAYVASDDVEGMRATLAAVLADEGRRAAMRAAGLVHARRFADAAIAGALFDVYAEVMGRPARP